MTRIYKQVGDYHDGEYDKWGLVSPWSKSACNTNADVMIVAQDWTSEDSISKEKEPIKLGYSPNLPTNINLQNLLEKHFHLSFAEVYATNLFVFVKPGNLSARIPSKDLRYSAKNYTLEEIKIINPKIVLCLGSLTFSALCRAIREKPPLFKTSIDNPVEYTGIKIFGIPHTGGFGTRNAGGMEKVHKIWRQLATNLKSNLVHKAKKEKTRCPSG